MSKLRVYIYSNHVPFDASQKSYEFKSSVKFGSCRKNSKICICTWFFLFYVRKYRFQVVIWSQILRFASFLKGARCTYYLGPCERSEPREWACQAQSRKSSKSSMVRASEASFASERSKRNLRKPSEAKQTAANLANKRAEQASKPSY